MPDIGRRASLFCVVLACTSLLLSACSTESTPLADAAFVGGASCVSCHEKEAEAWTGSHHDLAMDQATPAAVLGDFDDATFTYNGITSTFFRRDSVFFVRTDGPDGQLRDYRIDYTFGVTPLQQYLVEFPGGRYQCLGIAWDSRPVEQGGQRWFHLYPDETVDHTDPLHWTGIYQNWNYMCADCHSTNLDKNYRYEDDRFETSWVDIDVSCETCHGPGLSHVGWAEAYERDSTKAHNGHYDLTVRLKDMDGGGWVMDMETGTARRSPPRSDHTLVETCAPCHSRRSILDDDVRAGDLLMQHYRPTLLETGLYHADGQILDEVYVYGSFVQSKMYRAGVTCADCHDSHSMKVRAPYNILCASCHLITKYDTPEHHFHRIDSTGASCLDCHMPEQTYMVVDPRRDHSIRVPRPDLTASLGSPNACNQCHTDKTVEWAVRAVEEWYGSDHESHYGEILFAGRQGMPGADRKLVDLARAEDQPGLVRATALALLARYPSHSVDEVVSAELNDPDPLVRYGALRALEGQDPSQLIERVLPVLLDSVKAIRVEAGRLMSPIATSTLPDEYRHQVSTVVEEYVEAERFNLDRPESHLNLGLLSTWQGRYDVAESAYRAALSIYPGQVQAYINLADLYRLQGRESDAEQVLVEAQFHVPEAGAIHHALGLLLARTGRLHRALEELERAAQLQPDDTRFGYVYAIGLHSAGDTLQAMAVLERTLSEDPYDRDVLMALSTINRDLGRNERALHFAQTLIELEPESQSAFQLLRQLETSHDQPERK